MYHAAARERVDRAQAEVDRHVAAGLDGRCLGCGAEHPCAGLGLAEAELGGYGRLPRRRPGLASRGLIGGRRFGWFDDPAARS